MITKKSALILMSVLLASQASFASVNEDLLNRVQTVAMSQGSKEMKDGVLKVLLEKMTDEDLEALFTRGALEQTKLQAQIVQLRKLLKDPTTNLDMINMMVSTIAGAMAGFTGLIAASALISDHAAYGVWVQGTTGPLLKFTAAAAGVALLGVGIDHYFLAQARNKTIADNALTSEQIAKLSSELANLDTLARILNSKLETLRYSMKLSLERTQTGQIGE